MNFCRARVQRKESYPILRGVSYPIPASVYRMKTESRGRYRRFRSDEPLQERQVILYWVVVRRPQRLPERILTSYSMRDLFMQHYFRLKLIFV